MTTKPNAQQQAREWRAAYGMTMQQAEIVVALIVAKQLGYDGATAAELESIGLDRKHHFAELKRMRLIESLGKADGHFPVWAATPTAFRRFSQPMPDSFRAPDLPGTRIEESAGVREKRRRERKRERRAA